jgi:hypothetical protein
MAILTSCHFPTEFEGQPHDVVTQIHESTMQKADKLQIWLLVRAWTITAKGNEENSYHIVSHSRNQVNEHISLGCT